MARKNTNKHYSLRKLKTGTASVAVALSVLGAGLASQTEVKAEENERLRQAKEQALQEVIDQMPYDHLKNTLAGAFRKNQENERDLKDLNDALNNTILENIKSSNQHKKEIGELKSANGGLKTALDDMADTLNQASRKVNELSAQNKRFKQKQKQLLKKLWMPLTIKTSKSQNWQMTMTV